MQYCNDHEDDHVCSFYIPQFERYVEDVSTVRFHTGSNGAGQFAKEGKFYPASCGCKHTCDNRQMELRGVSFDDDNGLVQVEFRAFFTGSWTLCVPDEHDEWSTLVHVKILPQRECVFNGVYGTKMGNALLSGYEFQHS